MNNTKLATLTIPELEALIKAASREIAAKKAEKAKEVSNKVATLLKQEGLMISDILPNKSGPRKGLAVAIRYQDPNHPEHTWTGRGRMPIWMMEAIRAGANREDFILLSEELVNE